MINVVGFWYIHVQMLAKIGLHHVLKAVEYKSKICFCYQCFFMIPCNSLPEQCIIIITTQLPLMTFQVFALATFAYMLRGQWIKNEEY